MPRNEPLLQISCAAVETQRRECGCEPVSVTPCSRVSSVRTRCSRGLPSGFSLESVSWRCSGAGLGLV
ncbi:hypothetical protein ACFPRL_34275 [Pseudoclavibacter helvolus]